MRSKSLILTACLGWFSCLLSYANDDKVYFVKFENYWSFSIGDNSKWSSPNFDASEWEKIKVPSAWEDQNYYGYDGYAWYRISFNASKEMKNHDVFLDLGYIDDVDQVFLNGQLIGFSGVFPPEFSTPLEAKRKYPIPDEFINYQEKNTLCIRVYNHQMNGGIISGEPGLFYYKTPKPDFALNGIWNVRSGDNIAWKHPGFKDKQWKKLNLPGNWENQGYKGFDGNMWFRKTFEITEDLAGQKLALIFHNSGKCKVFLNGEMLTEQEKGVVNALINVTDESSKFKVYMIPENTLNFNKKNILAIKILKEDAKGGITEGPMGFFKLTTYLRNFKPVNGN